MADFKKGDRVKALSQIPLFLCDNVCDEICAATHTLPAGTEGEIVVASEAYHVVMVRWDGDIVPHIATITTIEPVPKDSA